MDESISLGLQKRSEHLVWTKTLLLSVINVLAFSGNTSVCYAVYRNQRLRSLPNMFVLALAVSDISISICCMLFQFQLCTTAGGFSTQSFAEFKDSHVFTFGMASLITMTLIAVSRYFCVTKQEKYILLFRKRRILVYIAGVCCVALAGSVPPLFFARGGYRLTPGHAACMYAFETNIAYTIFVKCVYIATPFSLITFCYIKVFCTVSRKNQLFSQENSPQKLRANLEEVKVTKTLATVMVCFTFCWIPVGIMDFMDAMRGGNTLPRAAYLIYGVLVYLSSTINPFIYAARNRHFRQEYKAILRKCCRFQSCEMSFGIRCCKVRGFAA